MDPLSVSASIVALLQATSQTVSYLYDVKKAGRERSKLAHEVLSLSPLLQRLVDRIDESTASDAWFRGFSDLNSVEGPLPRMRQLMDELQDQFSPSTEVKKIGQKLIWSFSKTDIEHKLIQIERFKSHISLILNDELQFSKNIQHKTQGTTLQVRSVEENKLLEDVLPWLSPLNFETQQDFHFDRAVPGTGEWFMCSDEFRYWISTPGDIIYCPGAGGTGKTMLSSIIIDHLRNSYRAKDTPVLFLYFHHKNERNQTLLNLVGNLLKQLLRWHPSDTYYQQIKVLWEKSGRGRTRPGLKDVTTILQSWITSCRNAFIVMDALDECIDESVRNDFLEMICDLRAARTNIFVTSRPMLQKFDGLTLCEICDNYEEKWLSIFYRCTECNRNGYNVCVDCYKNGHTCPNSSHHLSKMFKCSEVTLEAAETDLRRYVEETLLSDPRLNSICKKDPDVKIKIANKIVEAADGIFLFAKLRMDSLRNSLTPGQILKDLESSPASLDEIFEDAMQRIESQGEQAAIFAKRILAWVIYAHRPLSTREIRQALAMSLENEELDIAKIPDEKLLFTLTGGMVIKDYEQNLRLVHSTVQRYFERNGKRWISHGAIEVTRATLSYLNLGNFLLPCSGSHEDELLDNRLREYPFFVYVSQYWGYHAQEFQNDPRIRTFILRFLRSESRLASALQTAWWSGSERLIKGISDLHVAAYFNLYSVIDELISQGASIDFQDPIYKQTPLMYASKNGHLEFVDRLLGLACSVNLKSQHRSTAFIDAIISGQTHIATRLLKVHDLDVNATHALHTGRTAILFAIHLKNIEIVKLLAQHPGIQINKPDEHGRTALMYAAEASEISYISALKLVHNLNMDSALTCAAVWGREANLRALIAMGANPDDMDAQGGTPIHRAIDNGEECIVKVLMEHGTDLLRRDVFDRTLLHAACINGHANIAKILLDAGIDINVQGSDGETCLHDAARMNHLDIAKLLVERNADVSAKDNDGLTPLVTAVHCGNTDLVEFLREYDSDEVEMIELPLWSLVQQGKTEEVKDFISKGGDLDWHAPHSLTNALHVAVLRDNVEMLTLLLEAGMSPNVSDRFNGSALAICAICDHETCARIILQYDVLEEEKRRAWEICRDKKSYETAIALLEADTRIDPQDDHVQDVFFAAVENGNLTVVAKLLEYGIELQGHNEDNYLAIQLAKLYGHETMIEMLRRYTAIDESAMPIRKNIQEVDAS